VGAAPPKPDDSKANDKRTQDLLKLLAEHIPTHRNSPYSPYLPGFTSLRLLLLKRNRMPEDDDMLTTMLESYSSYQSSGREPSEIAWMMARDYMLLTQPANQAGSSMPHSVQSIQQQQQVLQQQLAQQRLQQAMQPQIGQVNPSASLLHNQFQQHQLQQLGALQAAQLSSGTSPIPIGAGQNGGFMSTAGVTGMSSLGHLGPGAGNGNHNGMATLSQLAQHHAVRGNGNDSSLSFQAMQQPKQEK
jgi:hypothetical protein